LKKWAIPVLVSILVLGFSLNEAFAIDPPDFVLKWGIFGTGEGQFQQPDDVAVDLAGNVYVVDNGNDRIQKFTNTGTFLRMWGFGVDDGSNVFQICTSSCQAGISGSGDGQFATPVGIAVDSADNVYVTDGGGGNQRIQKFDSNGNFLTKWGVSGTGEGQFTFPRKIAVDSDNNVYVADQNNHRIQKFTNTGTFLRMWGFGVDTGSAVFQICTSSCQAGIFGPGDGQFEFPLSVEVDSAGNVYVGHGPLQTTDTNRIQKFDSNGNFLTKFGTKGSADGQFQGPRGLAVDSAGNVYVADRGNERIQKFDSSDTFLTKWGSFCVLSVNVGCVDPDDAGPLELGDGQFSTPLGVAVDSAGNVYVADHGNFRIQKFAEPQVIPIGGTSIPIDTTALLVAGAQTISPWLILGVLSIIGIGLAVFTLKRNH